MAILDWLSKNGPMLGNTLSQIGETWQAHGQRRPANLGPYMARAEQFQHQKRMDGMRQNLLESGILGQIYQDPKKLALMQTFLKDAPMGAILPTILGQAFPAPAEMTDMQRRWQHLSPEERAKAARIGAGIDPRAAPAKDPIATLRARAEEAGLEPGTPAYAEFMRTGGKLEDSRAVYDASGNPIYLEGAAARERKPLREFDAKALQFYKRMSDALPRVEKAEASLQTEGGASLIDTFADNFGSAGNFIKSPEYQTYQAAAREWIAGLLRLDSGAAVPDSEFNRYFSTYFFAPGDNEQTRKAKMAARLAAMDALKSIQPPGYGTDGAAPPSTSAPAKPLSEYSDEELRRMLGE